MATWETYKGNILVPDAPSGDAGINLKNDLKTLRDYADTNSPLMPTNVQSANYTAAINDLVTASISGGSITVTAPASPVNGSRFGVWLSSKGTNANQLTISPNSGQTLNGNNLTSGNIILTSIHDYIEFSYKSSISAWVVTSDSRDTTPVTTATKTGAYTTSGNEMVVCDPSAASFTVTLQDGAAVNTRVGVYMAATASSRTVTITNPAASNPKIIGLNGNEGSSVLLYVAGDYLELQYIGSNTWLIVSDRRAPHVAELVRNSAQTISDNTETLCDFDDSPFDFGGLASTSSDSITIRRAGRYQVSGNLAMNNVTSASSNYDVELRLKVGSTVVRRSTMRLPTAVSLDDVYWQVGGILSLAAGDEVTLYVLYDGSASTRATVNSVAGRPRLSIAEIR